VLSGSIREKSADFTNKRKRTAKRNLGVRVFRCGTLDRAQTEIGRGVIASVGRN